MGTIPLERTRCRNPSIQLLYQIQGVSGQIQGLRTYVTESQGHLRVPDLAGSCQGTVPLKGRPR